jgi:hypothetical protein
MGLEVGGYKDHPDWPKMGPSLLIATCLILAIRTAKWPPNFDSSFSEASLDQENRLRRPSRRTCAHVAHEQKRDHFLEREKALVQAGR